MDKIKIEDFKMIINNYRKDVYGEVFTDIELVSDMLLDVKEEEWSNPKTNFFDPTCGNGYFLYFIYDILMGNGFKYKNYENIVGLKNIIKDEKEREKHIIENMLYGIDIQEDNIKYCRKLFKNDIYKTNFITSDFLKIEDIEIKFNIVEFYNIVGNPPFQAVMEDGKRKAKNHNLWSPIIIKSFNMLKKNGKMFFVCPSSWMSLSKNNREMFSIIKKNETTTLNINECRKYFKGVGNNFSFLNVKKTPRISETKIICEFEKKIYESKIFFDENIKCLPLLINKESISILNKTVFNEKYEKYKIKFDSYLHAFTKRHLLSKVEDEEHKYMLYHTTHMKYWSEIPHRNQNEWKILIPRSTYYEKLFSDNSNGTTQGMGYLICDSEENCKKIEKILKSKLFIFILNITRWGNWNSQDILYSLPMVDSSKEWTDEEIYKNFKLNDKEINLIEKTINKKLIKNK